MALGLALIDAAWIMAGHFVLDIRGYGVLAVLSLVLAAGAFFYQTARPDPRLAAMMFGASFLTAFSAAANIFNYLLLTVAGPRIDVPLAAFDRAIGFDWPATVALSLGHPLMSRLLFLAYGAMLPQVALMTILLARGGSHVKVYRFCLAFSLGALICIAIWALAPSFGAFSVYTLPPDVAARFSPALGADYARALVALLQQGPGFMSPRDAKGLIGFPSFHAVLALLVVYYAWPNRLLRWPLLALNLVVLVATPLEGGHHLVDVLAAFPVAAAAVFFSQNFAKHPIKVNTRKDLRGFAPIQHAFVSLRHSAAKKRIRRLIRN